ncbi:hypothetical protein EJ05DRAFT_396401 [Pseudovirgaria hyperparasitica]|uniref:Uncharacterized protein n=1 Tax=Pseudovirgaria hyperparasitica TaxID=470096 RepID=A0A6A6W6W0_9PEZI|nr:uncharacterized protein EJ05DRAFT_396401 [Pseudovirgaria hyperparasitica]KAF2757646.1 hypothetical protein EJ05DRAFT_396401 [Pseudovirgaria hyperparasitica]
MGNMTVFKAREATALEILPLEILQDIFLRTHNIDFALCSPRIGARLSSSYCYHLVCYKYFYESLSDYASRRFYAWEKIDISRVRDLQGRLMNMRWMTPTFFKGFLDYMETISTSHLHTVKCCLVHLRIPVKFLRGSLNMDRIDFLQFLLDETPLRLDWNCTETRLALSSAKKNAILQSNTAAVMLFVHERRLGKPPDIDLIRFAVLTAGCDRTVVFMLMQAARRWGLRVWQDEAIDEWVRQAKIDCNPKGAWLELKLLELRGPGGFPDPHTGSYSLPGDELFIPDTDIVLKSKTNRFAYSEAAS